MATELEYQDHAGLLAKACGAVLTHKCGRLTLEFPNATDKTPPHWRTIEYGSVFWRGVLIDLVAYAKREGISVPPSTELLLKEGWA